MPIHSARRAAEKQKRVRKLARDEQREQRLATDAACRAALLRAARPRHELLRDAVGAPFDAARFTGPLRPFVGALAPLRTIDAANHAAVADVVCTVEQKAPGFLLAECGEYQRYGQAVVRLAHYVDRFVRPLSSWMPPQRRPERIWQSLVAHVLHRFPISTKWSAVFTAPSASSLRDAVVAVAGGSSWREAGLPTFVGRAVAHALNTVDDDDIALDDDDDAGMVLVRDAQLRACGVSAAQRRVLAKHVDLMSFLDDEAGLEGVWRFLAQHPELSAADVDTIGKAFGNVEGRLPSMKGRTPKSLVALAQQLRKEQQLREDGRLDVGAFPTSPIAGGEYVLVDDKSFEQPTFVVAPIDNGKALVDEGIAMRHCVGTYAERAKQGEVVIFGVSVDVAGQRRKRALTIEVRPTTREIVQVRGKTNRRATDVERGIVRAWANEHGLTGAP
ncbi:MAG TPA: PcfJ domain-containing protein [Myxococcota bacterium]